MRQNIIKLERLSNGYVLRHDYGRVLVTGLYNPHGVKKHGDGPFLIDMIGGNER